MDREAIQRRFGIVGKSQALKKVIDRMRQVAPTDLTVTLEGESGVGKELVAQAIHSMSPRRQKPLVVVNCGAIPEGLIESELFGNEKGAYTGAVEQRAGHFEEADGGTLFMDEIGEMPPSAQVRLLRVLESGQFTRVGSSKMQEVDVRILAATNKDLAEEVRQGRFREDLYYRISTVLIKIPPVRERREDILPIFHHFLEEVANKYDAPVKKLNDSAEDVLLRYQWPGNVREMRNVAEQVEVLLNKDTVAASDIEPFLRGVTASSSTALELANKASGDEGQSPFGDQHQQLLYRFLMDLRMDVKELNQMVRNLVLQMGASGGADIDVSPSYGGRGERMLPEGGRTPGSHSESYSEVDTRTSDPDDSNTFMEDVMYEMQDEGDDETEDERFVSSEGELPTIEEAENALILQALDHFDGNRRKTADALGISERTLYRKLKQIEEVSDES